MQIIRIMTLIACMLAMKNEGREGIKSTRRCGAGDLCQFGLFGLYPAPKGSLSLAGREPFLLKEKESASGFGL